MSDVIYIVYLVELCYNKSNPQEIIRGHQERCPLFLFKTMKFYKIKNFNDKNAKETWEEVKGEYDGLSISAQTSITKAGENLFNAIFSTPSEDRDGDIVKQNFDLRAFRENPVFLDSHRYDSVEHIIGRIPDIKVVNGQLKGQVEFNLDNPKGRLAAKMADQGFLNATSIGFIPKAFDDQGNIERSEIIEISAVAVPSNSEALFNNDFSKSFEYKTDDGKEFKIKINGEDIEVEEIKEEVDEEEETTPNEEENEEEPEKEKTKKPNKLKKMKKKAAEIADKEVKERISKLRKLDTVAKEYAERVTDEHGMTKREKKDVNKIVRRLIDTK